MDEYGIQSETEYHFIGLLGELFNAGLPQLKLLNSSGIYKVLTPPDYTFNLKSELEVLSSNNVISPWPTSKLQEKWVENTTVIYIGLAGARAPRSLRKRLSDLLRHGRGNTTDRGPHRGGEIMWQLFGYEQFEIWAKPTGDPPIPRQLEKELLADFVNRYSKLPFANRQF